MSIVGGLGLLLWARVSLGMGVGVGLGEGVAQRSAVHRHSGSTIKICVK